MTAEYHAVETVGVKATTTDATETEIARFSTQANKTYLLSGRVLGRSTTNNAGYLVAATFKNVAGTITQVGTTAAIATHEDAGAWAVAFSIDAADDPNDPDDLGQIILTVTGEAGVTVSWLAAIDILEV